MTKKEHVIKLLMDREEWFGNGRLVHPMTKAQTMAVRERVGTIWEDVLTERRMERFWRGVEERRMQRMRISPWWKRAWRWMQDTWTAISGIPSKSFF